MRTSAILVCISATLAAMAQPTLTYDQLDLVGSSFDLYIALDPGDSDFELEGAAAEWDFTTAQIDLAGAGVFQTAANTPYAAEYPSADLAMLLLYGTSISYNYYDVSPTALSLLASAIGSDEERIYSDPSDLVVFPLSIGGQYNDDYTANGTPFSVVRTCTGYGTVEMVTGTFDNVVKISSSNGERAWWKIDPVEPLITINADGLILIWERITIGMAEQRGLFPLVLAPNPGSSMVRIAGLSTSASYRLIDATGRNVLDGRVSGVQNAIDVSHLRPGLYQVVVDDAQGRRATTLVKE